MSKFLRVEEPLTKFHEVLHKRSKHLFFKVMYGSVTFTNVEKDELAICARISRKL